MKLLRFLPLVAVLPEGLLIWQSFLFCESFVYSLDDPYIHLSLARQIAHGHYGINPGEFAAPSSSILWPFLLAPFTWLPHADYVPLVINCACLTITVWWLHRWFETWISPVAALVITIAVALCTNLYGLVMNGMEHSLQVMLVVIVGLSVVRQRFGWPFWVAVIVLPLVRYEGLAISLPVLAWLFLQSGRRVASFAAGTAIALIVGAFSLFLYSHGVGFLPSSVLSKSGVHFTEEVRSLRGILSSVKRQFFYTAAAGLATLLYLRERKVFDALLLVAAPTILHLLFGQAGWFGRYHVYFAVWIGILFLDVWLRSEFSGIPALNIVLVAVGAYASMEFAGTTLVTNAATRNISDQQLQMALMVRDLGEPVAVNDLGLVSYYARNYVLDLAGLASFDALQARSANKSGDWMTDLMARHHVEHAIIYDNWFPERPKDWIRVATLTEPLPSYVAGNVQVAFYSTNPEAAARLRKIVEAYRARSIQDAMMMRLEN